MIRTPLGAVVQQIRRTPKGLPSPLKNVVVAQEIEFDDGAGRTCILRNDVGSRILEIYAEGNALPVLHLSEAVTKKLIPVLEMWLDTHMFNDQPEGSTK